MSPALIEWREALLASAPAYSVALFAPPATRAAAVRAVPRLPPPADVPPERPEPVWIFRPREIPADAKCRLERTWKARFVVSFDGGEAITFHPYTGRRAPHKPGRHTRHGRLDVGASAARLAAYEVAEAQRREARKRFIDAAYREWTERAVRLGAGWMRVQGIPHYHGPHWIIFDPERGLWEVLDAMLPPSFTPEEVEKLEIIERGPPPRERAPSLTLDEVRAAVEARGYTAEVGVLAREPIVRIRWGGINLTCIFAGADRQIYRIGAGHEATLENLQAELTRAAKAAIATCEKQAARIAAEIEVLRGAP